MSHATLIQRMQARGIPVSPFMHYWTTEELLRYYNNHA